MSCVQVPIRLEERDEDASLSPMEAAKLHDTLKAAFRDGAIFAENAVGSNTHAALKAMRGRAVFLNASRGGVVCMAWPKPGSASRHQPMQIARDLFKLYDAYYKANFPDFEDAITISIIVRPFIATTDPNKSCWSYLISILINAIFRDIFSCCYDVRASKTFVAVSQLHVVLWAPQTNTPLELWNLHFASFVVLKYSEPP